MTTGGGMIVSNNEELLRKAKHLTTKPKVMSFTISTMKLAITTA